MMKQGGLLVYCDNEALREILQSLGIGAVDELNPTVDVVIINKKEDADRHRHNSYLIIDRMMDGRELMGEIIRTVDKLEFDVLNKLGVRDVSNSGRRILVWLDQAGLTGISPAELEGRVGGRNNLRTAIHALRKSVDIIFADGVYRLAKI
ncbi:MAG: hypothetical protein FWD33_03600 [Alphaproteobacteria bacterium]|nr:hypothetical protein [Alphaproteobacteria bacterium]